MPLPLPMPMMILMGFLARWGNTRGSLKKDQEVFLIFDENQTNFTLGRAGPGQSKGFIGMESPYVEPLHAQITWDPFQGVTIIDRGSRHGTWVWQGNRWKSLGAFVETPLTADQHVAFGLVYPQRDQIILNPTMAVQLVLKRGEDPNVWALSKDFYFPNKKLLGKEILDVDLSLLPSNHETQGILKKIVHWITRPEPTEFELQMIAEEFNQAGLTREAGLLHQKAVEVARKKLFYTKYDSEEYQIALESLAKTSAHYGDFLISKERLREAALQYVAAAEAITLFGKDEQSIMMRIALLGKAFYAYKELAQQSENRGFNLEAANYLERAGVNIPWIFNLQIAGEKWEPARHAIYCFARAALHYKKLGYRFSDDLERTLMDLNKIPLYLEEGGVGSRGMRSLVYRFSQSIREDRLQFKDLDRFLDDPHMRFSLEP